MILYLWPLDLAPLLILIACGVLAGLMWYWAFGKLFRYLLEKMSPP
jgi:hypothetical protein